VANTISLAGISPGSIIEADQLTRVIYALNGVSGSDIIMSGSLGVTGSAEFSSSVLFFAGATGSLYGTSSWAITASYALNAAGGDTGSLITTASFSNPIITFTKGNGSTFLIDLTSLVPNTASYALSALTASYFSGSISNAVSASYALTASYFAGSVVAFPYTGSAIISGSLDVTGSTNVTGSLFVNGLLVGAETGAQLAIWRYTSSLNTGIDPTSGYFNLNAAWSSSPTSASFDNTAYNPAVSFSGYLDNLTVGTVIKLVSLTEGGTYKLLQVVSVAPPESGYETFGVSQLTGAGNDPNDGDQFAFIPVGASGQGFNTIANPGPGRVILSDGSTNAASASANLIFTGSNFLVTGSTIFTAIGGETNIITAKSGSSTFLTINTGSFFDIYSSLFNVRNPATQQPVLTVSQSIVQFATQSTAPVGSTQAGTIWFTSESFYVGLE
jgi:hypothetical protein